MIMSKRAVTHVGRLKREEIDVIPILKMGRAGVHMALSSRREHFLPIIDVYWVLTKIDRAQGIDIFKASRNSDHICQVQAVNDSR